MEQLKEDYERRLQTVETNLINKHKTKWKKNLIYKTTKLRH
jgi:hypothetical protein